MVACNNQLLKTSGKAKLIGAEKSGGPGTMIGPAGAVVATRLPGALNTLGGLNSLNLVYLATPESLGRNAAQASSTRAAAPRTASSDAFTFQLVAAARAPTWSAVIPPGCTCKSSVGTGSGAASVAVGPAGTVAGRACGTGCAATETERRARIVAPPEATTVRIDVSVLSSLAGEPSRSGAPCDPLCSPRATADPR